VAFDPYDKDHRRYYAEFLEHGGWGKCPVRFVVPEDHAFDLPTMIRNSLIQYYIDREFGGSKLTEARSQALSRAADEMYRKAGQLRKQSALLKGPRRT
jgi:hypothetical protein